MTLLGLGVGALIGARTLVRKQRAYNLRGKVVLITGGSRGLGLLIARELVGEGVKLALCARDSIELEAARQELIAQGAEVWAAHCDVTDRASVQAFVQSARVHYGGIDVLINNAGVIEVGPIETMTLADYEEAMNTHFYGPLYFTMECAPEMQARRDGRIVNIASFGGKVSVPHMVPYSASKFALVGLSQGLRASYAKDNVLVTTVCPGLLRTGSHEHAIFKGQNEKEYTLFATGNANPLVSISGVSAAKQIVAALKNGDPEVILSVQAQVGSAFAALFPGVTADIWGLVNRIMPQNGGIGTDRAEGKDSHTKLAPSILTALSDSAARANNETD